jgi:hypothetical protein
MGRLKYVFQHALFKKNPNLVEVQQAIKEELYFAFLVLPCCGCIHSYSSFLCYEEVHLCSQQHAV